MGFLFIFNRISAFRSCLHRLSCEETKQFESESCSGINGIKYDCEDVK